VGRAGTIAGMAYGPENLESVKLGGDALFQYMTIAVTPLCRHASSVRDLDA